MHNSNNLHKTSRGQLAAIWSGVKTHIYQFRFSYGFLLGIFITVFSIYCVAWYSIFEAPVPWKIVDASDPRFDPHNFRLTDYSSKKELKHTLDILFPAGTDKTYVDEILHTAGGALVLEYKSTHPVYRDRIVFDYIYQNYPRRFFRDILPIPPLPDDLASQHIRIAYDQDLKVQKVTVLLALGPPRIFFSGANNTINDLLAT